MERNVSLGRGQVGIGTLIVFVALVLVAAVAAGVLVETAGLLESRAEDTGEDSLSSTSDRIEVENARGYTVNPECFDGSVSPYPGNYQCEPTGWSQAWFSAIEWEDEAVVVTHVSLLVTKGPGADDVDLNETTVQVTAADGSMTFVPRNVSSPPPYPLQVKPPTYPTDTKVYGSASDPGYCYEEVTGSNDVRGKDDFCHSPRVLNSSAERTTLLLRTAPVLDLRDGDSVRITITTASGATTVYEFTVPDVLAVDDEIVDL